MPRRCFTVDLKFSTMTSAFFAIVMKISCPSLLLRLSVIERLLRCRFWKSGPSRRLPVASVCSPGCSILMTSAPQSASWRTAVGPARWAVRSRTVKPLSGSEGMWASPNRRDCGYATACPLRFASPSLSRHPRACPGDPKGTPGDGRDRPGHDGREAMNDADLQEAVELERAADWRIRKLGENPEDAQSADAARLLQKLADDLRTLTGSPAYREYQAI